MRIILIDDDSDKIREISRTIKGVVDTDEILTCLTISDARKNLALYMFDIAIIDLHIGESLFDSPEINGGSDFIDEIITSHSLIMPNQIVILSAYTESERELKKQKDKLGYVTLHYDPLILFWREALISIINYHRALEMRRSIDTKCDLAIITAVTVESNAVKDIAKNWNRLVIPNDVNVFHFANITRNDKSDCKVIHAQQTEMGMAASVHLSTRMITLFSPKHLLMVGIAAGTQADIELGDIIIPTSVCNFSNGKHVTSTDVESTGDKSVFLPDPSQIPLSPELNSRLLVEDFTPALTEMYIMYTGEKPTNMPKVVRGPMACVSAVVANREIVQDQILAHSRKNSGLDLESYGVFYAAQRLPSYKCTPICIKSVSDFADGNKNDKYQKYAAFTSSKIALYLIQIGLL